MGNLRVSDCGLGSVIRQYGLAGRICGLCAALFLAGCTSPNPPPPPPPPAEAPDAPEVIAAESLFEKGKLKESIIACVDISRKNPEARGLVDLQAKITQRLAEQREEEAFKRSAIMKRLHSADAHSYSISPDTYKQQKHVKGENDSLRTAPTAMQKILQTPVTIHLVNADLSALIAQIGQSHNVNMIADSDIAPLKKTITIHVEKTPLSEVLKYIGRNLNVEFSVGNNVIWATPNTAQTTGLPLETRIYRLRKGLVGSELGRYPYGKTIFKGPKVRGQTRSEQEIDGVAKAGKVGLVETIKRFVPQPSGADFMFNDKAHILIVKNTPENLRLTEDIIEKLDIRPLQILIEARFVTTDVNDLKELGIEWLVDNRGGTRFKGDEISFTDKNGIVQTIKRGANYGKDTFPSATQFAHDALVGSTTKVTTDDFGNATGGGLSLGYQFLLGDTALQAVLHALQQNGQSETLAVPRVTTLNNREARFRLGEDIVYYEDVNAVAQANNAAYGDRTILEMTFDWNTPMTLEVGYSLTVTPSVGSDLSTINLVLRPEISDVVHWRDYKVALARNSKGEESSEVPHIQLPIVSRQYIETETTVRSGETVILGGLVNTKKIDTDTNTPWFSTLPLFGNLFKMEDHHTKTQNVLVFVTATLISDIGESLIPLNEYERYGKDLTPEDTAVDILKFTGDQARAVPPAKKGPQAVPPPPSGTQAKK